MDRREFLKEVGLGMVLLSASKFSTGCAHLPGTKIEKVSDDNIDTLFARGAKTMWVAPHPDDECFSGPILARSGVYYKNPLYFLVFTHGDGGECCLKEGCHPDLATIRGQELKKVADFYGAELEHHRFYNAPLPAESFPPRHEIYKKWLSQGDPLKICVKAIRRFKPDVIITFHPDFGATGHPEHQLASRIATTGAKLAQDPTYDADGIEPHKVHRLYWLVQRYWLLRAFGLADPGPVTEVFDSHLPAKDGMSCLDFSLEATRFHKTQNRDMSMVRRMQQAFGYLFLRQVDYMTVAKRPDAVVTKGGGMGHFGDD
jgi:LmbE family N-acetylglucosaminyl deacetylase